MQFEYPAAKRTDFSYETAGHTISDPYVWLEDRNDPDTEAFTRAQEELTEKYFSGIKKYDVAELASRLKAESKSIILRNMVRGADGKIYATRCDENKNTTIVLLDEDMNVKETVLSGEMIGDRAVIHSITPSPFDARYCFFSMTVHGAPKTAMLVYDLQEKREIAQLDNTMSAMWVEGGKAIYYEYVYREKETGKVTGYIRRCSVPDGEISVFHTAPGCTMMNCAVSPDGKSIFVTYSERYFQNKLAVYRDGGLTEMTKGIEGFSFKFLTEMNGKYYIRSNRNAPLGEVIAVPVSDPDLNKAEIIIPESKLHMMNECIAMDGLILCKYTEDCKAVLRVFDADGRELPAPKLAADILDFSFERTFDNGRVINISYQSFVDAPSVMQWRIGDSETRVIYRSQPGIDASAIDVSQHFVTARDGEKIPCFVVMKKDTVLNGNNPTLMYGYGGYGLSQFPHFLNNTTMMPVRDWVMEGGIYVLCNLRGGNEYGLKWHDAGRFKNKKNCFRDYIDIAEWLIACGYTRREKLAISGESNGGLLVTACLTMRPDLFGCAVASVAHTDMIRFRFDARGPMYTFEYGDPNDPEFYDYMISYSPYHNIKATEYPPIYLHVGERDNNVPSYHSKKFLARLLETKLDKNPALLHSDPLASHDRGSGDGLYKTCAQMRIFLYENLGM